MRVYELHHGTGPDALRLAERPVPEPGPGQILVRIHAASLNYRDLAHLRNPKLAKPGTVPLSDGAGEVVALGAGATRFAIGDRIAGNFFQDWMDGPIRAKVFETALGGSIDGVLSEFVVFNQWAAVKIPDALTYAEAATLPCAAVTAWNALAVTGKVRAGQCVVLLGTGGVSVFALQLAKVLGARVIITSSSDEKLERARALGADETINYRTHKWDEEVLRLTGSEGADHVIEVGGAGTLPQSLRAVRTGGTVELIGVLSGQNQINPMPVLYKVITLAGVYVGSTAIFEELLRVIEFHRIAPVIDHVFEFDQAPEAYTAMEGAGHFGKLVIQVA